VHEFPAKLEEPLNVVGRTESGEGILVAGARKEVVGGVDEAPEIAAKRGGGVVRDAAEVIDAVTANALPRDGKGAGNGGIGPTVEESRFNVLTPGMMTNLAKCQNKTYPSYSYCPKRTQEI